MKKHVLLALSLSLVLMLLAGCSSAQKEVPDSIVQSTMQQRFWDDPNPEIEVTVSHSPDTTAHTDTVNGNIKAIYEFGIENYSFQACYQYDRTSDLWTQSWLQDVQYLGCAFLWEQITGYSEKSHYARFDWEYEILEIDPNTLTTTIHYKITIRYSNQNDELTLEDTAIVSLEYEPYDNYYEYDRMIANIKFNYPETHNEKSRDINAKLIIVISSKTIESGVATGAYA